MDFSAWNNTEGVFALLIFLGLPLLLFMVHSMMKESYSDDSEDEIIPENSDKEKLSIKEKPIEKNKIPEKPEVKKETPKPKFCTNCGNPYFRKTAFCTNCGNKII